jgi:hypothetical protein
MKYFHILVFNVLLKLSPILALVSKRKTFDHFGRSHGRNGSKGGFTVYEKESPQKQTLVTDRQPPHNNGVKTASERMR